MRSKVTSGVIMGITLATTSGGSAQDLMPDPLFLERGLFLLAALLMSLYMLRERTR